MVKKGKALRKERKVGIVFVCNRKEERERPWLIPLSLEPYIGLGVGGKRREEGRVYIHVNALQGGKNWHEERSAQIAWGLGICFKMAIPRATTTTRLKPHEQCSVRTLPHIYHLTLSDIPTPWSSETDGHPPLCGPNCVTAISSNSICGSFNAIKMGTKGEGSALLLGWDRQW